MPLAKLMEHDTDTTHAVLISGTLSHLPNESSETDSEDVSIEPRPNTTANFLEEVLLPGLADVPQSGYQLTDDDFIDI